MIFELTDEQKLVQETAREFAHNDIAPTLEEEEKHHEFRLDRVARMGELGFFSCAVPEELGGTGFGFMESVLMAEQVAKVSASWRLPFNMQNLGPALTVAKFGTEAQKHKFIPGWVAGTQIGFFGMTEPESGSDVASMKTVARDRGHHWELRGNKTWVSNAVQGDAGLLYAMTNPEKKHRGMSAFILEPKQVENLVATNIDTKLGLHCAPTGELAFDGTQLPKDALLGTVGDGFKICMWQLNNTRLGCAAGALGGRRCGARAGDRLRQRTDAIREADFAAPDDPGADRRDGGRARGGADARVPGRVAQGQRDAEPVRDLRCQAAGVGGGGARRERMHEDIRVLRVFHRVSGRTAVSGRQVAADRGGHLKRAEDHHRRYRLRAHAK